MQHEFARSAGMHPSTLSALFVRPDAKLGDLWAGIVDALGLTAEEAWQLSREWSPPEPPADDEGSDNLRLGIEMFERSEGKVGRAVRKAMLRVLNSRGDMRPDEWMAAIRVTRVAMGPGAESAEEPEPPPPPGAVPTAEAGKPLPSNPPTSITSRRKQPRR